MQITSGLLLKAGITFTIVYGLAYLINFLLKKITHITAKTKTTLDDEIVLSLKTPIKLAMFLTGLFFALNILHLDFEFKGLTLSKIFSVAWILTGAFALTKVISAILKWYSTEKTKDQTVFLFLRRVFTVLIYILAFMIVFDKLGIEISPMLAGLGIAGLAVALALQDTLSNFFASVYIAADRPVKVGDYIKFEDKEGYVEDIGWRSTKIRTIKNNLIVIPNEVLVKSVITNYSAPSPNMTVTIPCGVSYNSDLKKVEQVALKVAKEVIAESDGALKSFEPKVRFTEFADSSINFITIIGIERFADKFEIIHKFIKRLHEEFNKQEIEIPFPQMDVHLKKD